MADIKTCDNTECSSTIDIDIGEGVIKSSYVSGEIVNKYFCSKEHIQ